MILGVRNFALFIGLCLSVAGREYAKSTHEWLLPRLALLLAGGTLIFQVGNNSCTCAARTIAETGGVLREVVVHLNCREGT